MTTQKPRRGRPPKPQGEKAQFVAVRLPEDAGPVLRTLAASLSVEKGVPVSMAQAAGIAVREAMARRAKA